MIAICAALQWEARIVLRSLKRVHRVEIGGVKAWQGVGAEEVLVFRTGMGPQRAARAAEEALDRVRAKVLINIGCAGGLSRKMKPGTLVIPARVLTVGQEHFECDAKLALYLREAAERAAAVWFEDSVVTVERPPTTRAEKRALFEQVGAAAVDMESAAVARVAAARIVPFACLRAILDDFETELPGMERLTTPEGTMRPFAAIALGLSKPSMIRTFFQLSEMGQASAKSLQTCLKEALSRSAPFDSMR